MAESSIEWTDATWNPVTGCEKVSPGCAHCYAETLAVRFWGDRPFSDVRCHEDRIDQPLHWRKPRRVFVNSMSDLFHDAVPDAFIDKVFGVMALASQHTFQILTKRPARMLDYLSNHDVGLRWLQQCYRHGERVASRDCFQENDAVEWTRSGLPNVHLGVSAENQRFLDERLPLLLRTPAAQRFLSCEPLLEGLDIGKHRPGFNRLWVIVGGESGPSARPCEVWWIQNIVAQCRDAGVPVFVKQLGAAPIVPAGRQQHWEWGGAIGREARFEATDHLHPASKPWRVVLASRKGGDMAEWPESLRVRQFPEVA